MFQSCSTSKRVSGRSPPNRNEPSRSPPQHVTLLSLLENQHELIDAVYLVLDVLDERSESIGDVVDQGVGDPVRGDVDVVLELLDTPADVLRMRSAAEVELSERREVEGQLGTSAKKEERRTESVPSRKTMMYMLSGSR